ncbi:helix-turn-helix domain-containing protein [Muricauda sp. JGD-17]|uniref:Helix-turn-helix domain-containing protein n=1 Tax=Flagellimonas ochracea TaxID=2696472 RepID=A0A964WWQ7_9FLAO|nr:helix-turn-helix transcriptional regulator [Allomuricauda ochracea]NAY91028.1 helix-turn-helix domain-containing protein [Allomuricauda ochracea]
MNDSVIYRLQRVIEHYGLTVSAFADHIGVQRSSVSHVLSGRNKPSLDFVMKLVKTYPEVNLYWLLNGKGSFPAGTETESPTLSLEGNDMGIKETKGTLDAVVSAKRDFPEAVKVIIVYDNGTFESYDTKNR